MDWLLWVGCYVKVGRETETKEVRRFEESKDLGLGKE